MISLCKGLGYDEGKTVIVEGALTGEEVEYEKISEKKGMIEGRVREILTSSPLRVSPICPYYGVCGGCDFQIVGERDSAYIKEEIVKDTMKRVGRLDTLPPFDPPSYSSFNNYRIRCRVHVDIKTKRQGFLKANSNQLVDISHCPALEEKLDRLLSERGGEIFRRARELMFENRVNRDTGFVEVPLFSGDNAVSMSDKSVDITVGGIKYLASASVFFQSNPKLLESMLGFVKENVEGESIMDLYSGVGTFSALFNGEDKTVFAVERERKCLELSKKNAPSAISFTDDCARWGKNKGKHVDTVIVDPPRTGLDRDVISLLEEWMPESIMDLYSGVGTFSALFNGEDKTVYAVERERKCLELSKKNAPSAISFTDDCARWGKNQGKHVATVIVDPPRTGLDRDVISLLEEWKPERIIYISCNPVTASRDLALFSSYYPIKAKVFDCYPGSSHVETVVLMSRVNTPKE